MRSGISRGAPEWSGGKDLYMESCFRGSGKSSVFSGIVPGSFQKVPEDSGGVRKSRKWSTMSLRPAWAVGGCPGLIGPGAPAPTRPMRLVFGETLRGRLHLAWGPSLPSLGRHPLGCASPRDWGRGKAAPPRPLYKEGRGEGRNTTNPNPLSLPLLHLLVPVSFSEVLPTLHHHHHHHTVVLVVIPSTSPPSLAGSRTRRRHRATRVLNSEVPSVRC